MLLFYAEELGSNSVYLLVVLSDRLILKLSRRKRPELCSEYTPPFDCSETLGQSQIVC